MDTPEAAPLSRRSWRYLVSPALLLVSLVVSQVPTLWRETRPTLDLLLFAMLIGPGVVDAALGTGEVARPRHAWRLVSLTIATLGSLLPVLQGLGLLQGLVDIVFVLLGIGSVWSTTKLLEALGGAGPSTWARHVEHCLIVCQLYAVLLAHVVWIAVRYEVGYWPWYEHPHPWSTLLYKPYAGWLDPLLIFFLTLAAGPFATLSAVGRACWRTRRRADIVWAALAVLGAASFWWDPFGACFWFWFFD